MFRKFFFVAASLFVLAASAGAQGVDAKVEEYLTAAVRVGGFSGSVLIARDGRPVFRSAYGMANRELEVPNTPETVFRIGSLTKGFTAAAIMLLQERGKLQVSDRLCSHLSDCPPEWQRITIRNLLTHTSGITSYTQLPDYPTTMGVAVTHEIQISRIKGLPLEFGPGEKYSYSNSGYYLLGVIIERVSGKPYADFLQENIFTPLDLKNTGYDTNRRVIRNRASGYLMQGGAVVNALYIDMSVPFAAGALVSTVDDLLRWDEALVAGKLLSRKSLDEMFAPATPEGYGYGWGNRRRFDRQVIEHDGGINGFTTSLSRFPADRVTVIVLGNNANMASRTIANDLSAIMFGAPYEVPKERTIITADAATLAKYVGQYKIPSETAAGSGAIHTLTLENGRLIRQVNAAPKVELFPVSDTEFFAKGVDVQIFFNVNEQGHVTGLTMRRLGRDTIAPKIK
jgi:CubicO group peptidase (beta-lactamase class C family)